MREDEWRGLSRRFKNIGAHWGSGRLVASRPISFLLANDGNGKCGSESPWFELSQDAMAARSESRPNEGVKACETAGRSEACPYKAGRFAGLKRGDYKVLGEGSAAPGRSHFIFQTRMIRRAKARVLARP